MVLEVILTLSLLVVAWRTWLALFPGLSLRADYGIRGGWFGSTVEYRRSRTSSGRYWSR